MSTCTAVRAPYVQAVERYFYVPWVHRCHYSIPMANGSIGTESMDGQVYHQG